MNQYSFFQRTKTKNFTIHMDTQKSPNSQAMLRNKNRAGGINFPEFRLNYKLRSSRAYGTGTKTEI